MANGIWPIPSCFTFGPAGQLVTLRRRQEVGNDLLLKVENRITNVALQCWWTVGY
ncbi:hypothetical protein ACFYKX_10220 [Cytobacillus sp. FJAT-54145]|uniref:Uncharacterized protein n=1 Tax=Cytobacillus spartinae TaxID=3299023 RepID=A0ABW6K9X3_9BACI